MSEEEKNAIEYLKARLYGNEGCTLIDVAQEDLRMFLKIVENQQKGLKQADKIMEELDEEIIKKNNKIFDLECNIEKQEEEIERLKNANIKLSEEKQLNKGGMVIANIDITKDNLKDYISKDKVLKALGYEENDEEYKRIYNKDEMILSLIRTIFKECERLEDIEDKKVEVAVDFIEEKRDKYWQKKIRDKIKEITDRTANIGLFIDKETSIKADAKREVLKELLKEN